ncbi:helix-turn-helix domain-containing protein [Ligilactobacillus saerimneri]|uniref:Helix-turn-helix domain-containing protein n=1 Tax=Ligilactobacillus saerimneri TaxID=228229 RepID=A0A7H9EMH8_9LACO|nr:helix-turn-helix domain-containing protein [Ligilactobacillus saerimneri]QLL78502.1 helix-turn-helix domain-containing protein [Ligilactobacillus saerimneri]
MTKYQPELKAQIVHEYLTTSKSLSDLEEKYHISYKLISEWVNRYRLQGIDAFWHRKSRRFFSVDFKLRVIDYYQTHEESMASVAAKFDLLPHQISVWLSQFQTGGIEALKPHRKGRKPQMTHSKNKIRHLAGKTEVERLKEELAQKNKELRQTKLERDILKKSLALFGPSRPNKKHR